MKTPNTTALIQWLSKQIELANVLIEEAKITKNYGKQTHYSGMKQAYLEMLNKLNFNKETIA